jgi:hypothetical protein
LIRLPQVAMSHQAPTWPWDRVVSVAGREPLQAVARTQRPALQVDPNGHVTLAIGIVLDTVWARHGVGSGRSPGGRA